MGVTMRAPFGSGSMDVMGKPREVRGGRFEVADDHEANWCVEHRGCVPVGASPRWKTAKKVVLKRGRGLGDLLMTGPVAREMKRQNPGMHLCLACDAIFVDLMKGVRSFDRIVTQPQLSFHKDEVWVAGADGAKEKYDCWVNLDMIAEQSPKVPLLHRIDIFGEVLGFPPGSFDRRLEYAVLPDEKAWAAGKLAELGVAPSDKVLAMALRCTCFNRCLPGASEYGPGEVNRQIAAMAAADGWKVMLFDHDRRLGFEGDGVVNLTGRTRIREMGALLERADLFIGPDTGAWHMACALGRPNLVYFGAINWRLRVTSPLTKVVFKNAPCYPCDGYSCHWKERVACMKLKATDIWPPARDFEKAAPWKAAGYVAKPYDPFADDVPAAKAQTAGFAGVARSQPWRV
jgi:hypothetical protein